MATGSTVPSFFLPRIEAHYMRTIPTLDIVSQLNFDFVQRQAVFDRRTSSPA